MPQIYLIRIIRTIRIIINIIIVDRGWYSKTRQWLHKVESIWTIQHTSTFFPTGTALGRTRSTFILKKLNPVEKSLP